MKANTRTTVQLTLVAMLYGCGDSTMNGESTFRGSSNILEDPHGTIFLRQASADSFADTFTQLDASKENIEEFVQGEKFGALDIALVVDDSKSMEEEQKNLATKLEKLLSEVNNADWRIGITTTSKPKRSILEKLRGVEPADCNFLIKKSDEDPHADFRRIIESEIGTKGSGIELGLYKAKRALVSECKGEDWLRSDSALAVLIISDEDNCSYFDDPNNDNCAGTNSGAPEYLLDHLKEIRTLGVDTRVYGIISETENPCADAQNKGVVYEKVISATAGKSGSICDSNYSNTLASISKNLASVLNVQFKLAARPIKDSVVVTVNGEELPPSAYILNDSALLITNPPASGSQVRVNYRVEAGALTKTFSLSQYATKEAVRVFLDGIEIAPSEFYIDEINQKLVFYKEPKLGTDIEVLFDSAQAPLKRYLIKKGLRKDGMSVSVDGQLVKKFKYDPGTGFIEFAQAPEPGAAIEVKYLK